MTGNLFDDYCKALRLRVAPSTFTRKVWELGTFARWLEQNRIMFAETRQADVEKFLLSFNASTRYRRLICATLRHLFDYCNVNPNPAASVLFKPDRAVRLFNAPAKSVVNVLINTLDDQEDILRIRDRLIAELAYGSGLRRDELRRINIENVDLDAKTVCVTGKGSVQRMVPLTSKTVRVIRRYLACRKASRGPLLVSHKNKRLSCGGIYLILHDRLGIRPHLLRHACATHMLENGASLRIIQELLGHKDLRSTQIYTQVEKRSLRKIVSSHHPRAQKSSGNKRP